MEGLYSSRPLLRQVIALDPNFADAYSEMAGFFIRRGGWRGDLTPLQAKDRAMPFIEKALALNSELASAHEHLGFIKFWFEWDFEAGKREFIKGGSLVNHGYFLLLMGRFNDALEKFEKNHVLDPFETHDRPHRGITHYLLNQPKKAIQILEEGVALHPHVLTGYHYLGKIYLNMEKYQEAVEILEKGMEYGNIRIPAMLGELAIAYFQVGQKEKALTIIRELKQCISQGKQGSPAYFIAQIYAGMGDDDLAFEWLQKAYEAHEVEMIWLKVEPQFQTLHPDPRFKELLMKVGFGNIEKV